MPQTSGVSIRRLSVQGGSVRERPDDFAFLTTWLKVALLVYIVWSLLERVASYFAGVGYATLVGIGGLFLAYLVVPIVRRLNARLPLWASIAIVYAALGAVALAAAWYLVPIISYDLDRFVGDLPRFERELRALLDRARAPMATHAPHAARGAVDGAVAQIDVRLRDGTRFLADHVLNAAMSFVSLAALAIAIPVTSVYMLVEASATRTFLLGMLHPERRASAAALVDEIDAVLGGFVRGQVLVAVTVALMVSAMLLVLHVPYAILIGVWAGVLDMVPYLGAAAGAIPGVLVALLSGGLVEAGLASLGFAAIFELEGNLIAPKIVSKTVNVSPLAVIFAVIVGGEAFGFGGMLVAVPVLGVVRVLCENVRRRHA